MGLFVLRDLLIQNFKFWLVLILKLIVLVLGLSCQLCILHLPVSMGITLVLGLGARVTVAQTLNAAQGKILMLDLRGEQAIVTALKSPLGSLHFLGSDYEPCARYEGPYYTRGRSHLHALRFLQNLPRDVPFQVKLALNPLLGRRLANLQLIIRDLRLTNQLLLILAGVHLI